MIQHLIIFLTSCFFSDNSSNGMFSIVVILVAMVVAMDSAITENN